MADVLILLRNREGAGDGTGVVAAGAAALAVDGIAVSLAGGSTGSEALWCSGPVSRGFEDLQFTLGEGPGPECAIGGVVVRVPDLSRVRHDRWPALIMEAPGQAARAVFCFPLRIGAIVVGVLTAVQLAPGHLSRGQNDDAFALAAALTTYLLERGASASGSADPLPSVQHAVVHQATGMVSVQLAVSLADALLRLRAHAFSTRSTLTQTAQDIVARRLRLASDAAPPPPAADKD